MIYSFTLIMTFILLTNPAQLVFLDTHVMTQGSWINYQYSLMPTMIQKTPNMDLKSQLVYDANITIKSLYSQEEAEIPVPPELKSMGIFSADNYMLQVAYNIYFAVWNRPSLRTEDGLFGYLTKYGIIARKVYFLKVPKNPLMKSNYQSLDSIEYVTGALIDYSNFKFLIIPFRSIDDYNQYFYIPVSLDSGSGLFQYRTIDGSPVSVPASAEFKVQGVSMPSSETVLTPSIEVFRSGRVIYAIIKNPNPGYVPITFSDRYKLKFDTVIASPGESVHPLWFYPDRAFLWTGMIFKEIRSISRVEDLNTTLMPVKQTFYSGEEVIINTKVLPPNAGDVTVTDLTTGEVIHGVGINYETSQIKFTAPTVPLFRKDVLEVRVHANDSTFTTYVFVEPPIKLSSLDYDTSTGVIKLSFSDNPLKPIYKNVIGTLTVQVSQDGQPIYTQDISMFNLKQTIELQGAYPSLHVGTNRFVVTVINTLPNSQTTQYSIMKVVDVKPEDYIRGVIVSVDGGNEKKHLVYDNGKVKVKVLLDTADYGGYESLVKIMVNGQTEVEKAVGSSSEFTLVPPIGASYMEIDVIVDGYLAYSNVLIVGEKPITSSLIKNAWWIILTLIVAGFSYRRYQKMYPEKQIVKEGGLMTLKQKLIRLWYYNVASVMGASDVRLIKLVDIPAKNVYVMMWLSVSKKEVYVLVVSKANPTWKILDFKLDLLSAKALSDALNINPTMQTIQTFYMQAQASQSVKMAQEFEKAIKKEEAKTLDEEVEAKNEDEFELGGEDEGGDEELFGGDEEDADFGDLFADEDEEENEEE